MNTEQTWQILSTSSEDTLNLAATIASKFHGGEVVELVSDLGGGKTTFTRGLAKGIQSSDNVHSPSFTLANEYKGNNLTIYHLDLYRLTETGVVGNELAEFLDIPNSVVVVEWPGLVDDLLPAGRVKVEIKVVGDNERQFNFTYPNNLSYLFK